MMMFLWMLTNYTLTEDQRHNMYLRENYDALVLQCNALEEQYDDLLGRYNQLVQTANQIIAGMQQEHERILEESQEAKNSLIFLQAEYDRLVDSINYYDAESSEV